MDAIILAANFSGYLELFISDPRSTVVFYKSMGYANARTAYRSNYFASGADRCSDSNYACGPKK